MGEMRMRAMRFVLLAHPLQSSCMRAVVKRGRLQILLRRCCRRRLGLQLCSLESEGCCGMQGTTSCRKLFQQVLLDEEEVECLLPLWILKMDGKRV